KKELEILEEIARSQKLSKRVVSRSRMLSYYFECRNKKQTMRDLKVSLNYVYTWVNRWLSYELDRFEKSEEEKAGKLKGEAYKRFIINLLKDKSRSGTPDKFTEIQKNQIVALGLEKPLDLGLPFTHWTHELLSKEVIARGIVEKISARHLGRILKKSTPMSS
ncbi:MAG: transposase, partial [Saprospiraceae bacterium]